MRIMMLAQFYPPLIGGEERFARDLSVQLAARGHDVSVITILQQGLPEFEMDEGVRVYRVTGTMQRLSGLYSESSRRHTPPFPDPELLNQMRHIIAREQPEIVHAHNWIIHSFLPLKRWSKARLILTLGDYSFVCAKKKLIFEDGACSGPGFIKCLRCGSDHYGTLKGVPTVLANWGMGVVERNLVDLFLPVSHAVAVNNGLVKNNLPFQVLTPFIPDESAQNKHSSESLLTQLPKGDFLLFVGAFGHYKGVDVLLQAHAQLDNPPPLVIVGYQTSEHPVKTTDLPDNVTVLKDLPHHEVMQVWRRAMFGLVPSTWAEPFGIVALEAMIYGHAVIASNIGGLSDIVSHGETGILVPPGDIDALRDAMQCLIADPALRQRMGAAGKERVRHFFASAVVPRYEQIYRELAEKHQLDKAHQTSVGI